MTKEKLSPEIRRMHEEHLRRMEGKGRATLEKYIHGRGKEIRIDWKSLIKDHNDFIDRASEGICDRTYADLLYYLQIKGVLTWEGKSGSYFISGCGMKLNPSDNAVNYEFTRKEDAEQFKKWKYGGAMYSTQVCQNC